MRLGLLVSLFVRMATDSIHTSKNKIKLKDLTSICFAQSDNLFVENSRILNFLKIIDNGVQRSFMNHLKF